MFRKLQLFFVRSIRRWDRRMTLTKRQQFVIITVILTATLMLTQLASADYRYAMVAILAIVAYGLCAFGLRGDMKGVEWVTLLVLPTFFTAAVALFYFLLPVRWLTRVPVAILYAIGMYALLLTENIYNIAAARTIALLRAAHSVGFLLTLVTFYLLIQTILAFRLPAPINGILVGAVTLPLTFQLLWAIELQHTASAKVNTLTWVFGLLLFELAWIFSFWPVRSTLLALFLTTAFYGLAGLGQQYLGERLYKRTVWEFFIVVAIVLSIVFFASNWYHTV